MSTTDDIEKRSEQPSETVLRLSKGLLELDKSLGPRQKRELRTARRFFVLAGIALESLAAELAAVQKSGELPSGWQPSRRPESDQG
jgi:hypothetical protein